jgi:hypothetical protein
LSERLNRIAKVDENAGLHEGGGTARRTNIP